MPRKLLSLGVLACSWLLASGVSADWPRFRGPNGSGVSSESEATPVKWSPKENVKWTVELPGPGVSSPIVVGDAIFVSSWSGYGIDAEEPGAPADLRRHLSRVDASQGEILWTVTVGPAAVEDPFNGRMSGHGYASNTPVSDGERVFVFFGKPGVLAYDFDGKELWHTDVGTGASECGFSGRTG